MKNVYAYNTYSCAVNRLLQVQFDEKCEPMI